ncbi:Serine/threonine-protein kinase HipA [Achromobacter denitrificans]|uniref:type II toxin-antitoxin system HipA family toxin n=1 Tax=Achromobacter denitrificans TaxID=32002 RepID=UPI000786931A|nr:type II toxin-antitoxin system HipA family toxin [Achromobacter denitrificans]OLU09330.1 toxin HipA [Achromobacter denitrificans]QKH41644.1 type II toxin-antitoxin system HipA family toxin [Achromobacter denitrificans]QKH51213.1 type II toxin-antitoxin system HipA family toxin [Achromobacter denitrificans]CAB3700513.1 Serine/threonine-protein kinase toxin HipA [Achromobacter denitrificans]SUU25581.1 Serine/threonine-protein kinase HipA [Achromobacter denitrificans]
MGRRSHSRSLSIWTNGIHVGRWTIPARGERELQYDANWVGADIGRPLSLSLPFNLQNLPLRGEKVANYFDNLLPDSDAIRRRAAERFKTGSIEPFDLLAAIGRDCVGAVQLLGQDEEPEGFDRIEGVPLSEEDIERHLIETVTPLAFAAGRDPDADFRISLAGAQEKTAFLWWGGQWLVPQGATPTSHIFKLPLGLMGGRRADFSTSVDNEWLCLRLLKAYGLAVADADIATFGRQRALVVERFDRRVAPNGQWLMRLPQEDFCQVEGCSPLRKYENEGGPGLKALFATLRQSVNAEADMKTLMAAQVLFWLLRAPDGHAKNFSIQLRPRGRFQLSPLYDVMSVYPVLGDGPSLWSPYGIKSAMALFGKNRHYEMHSIQRRHFNSTAQRVGYAATAEPIIEELLARTPAAIAEVQAALPRDFSPRVADAILGGLEQAAKALGAMAP